MIRYVGPKPLILAGGVEFDHKKEDKYIYLSIAAELIRLLDHDYVEGQRYVSVTGRRPLDPETTFSLIRSYDPELETEISKRVKHTEADIAEEIERAHSNRLLNEEARSILLKNIEMMRDYRIQRTINKTVYYSGVESLVRIIRKGHIDYITAPMFPIFVHIFHSVEGVLAKQRPPIDSEIDIYEDSGHLNVRLTLKNV